MVTRRHDGRWSARRASAHEPVREACSEKRPSSVGEPPGDETDEEHDEKQGPRRDGVVAEVGECEDDRLPDDGGGTPVSLLEVPLEETTEERLLLEGGDSEAEEPAEQEVHDGVRRRGAAGFG